MTKFYLTISFLISLWGYAGAQWKQTNGPGAGKTVAMIAVGNDLYAANRYWGGTDGRVYKSTDLGKNWVPADNGMSNTYSHQFENIGNTIFSATSVGVFRTRNAGSSWVLKPTVTNVLSMTHRDSILFIGMEGAGVNVSYDLGNTFIWRNNGLGDGVVWVLSMERLGRYVFAGVASGGGYCRMYRTGNDGLLWELKNTGLPDGANPVDFTVNGSALFVSLQGVGISGNYEYNVYRSLDSGSTWQPANTGLPTSVLNGNTAEIFSAYGDIYVSTTYPFNEPMVYKSSDNGNHWSVVGATGFRKNEPAFSFAAAGGYVFAGLASYGSVFRTGNAGLTWEYARKGLANSSVHALIKQNNRLYSGSQEGLFYSTDKGSNWTQVDDPLLVNLPVTCIEKNGSNIYLGTDGYGIYSSADNGTSWVKSSNGLKGVNAPYITDIHFTGNALYAATWSGIYKSTDNAANWIAAKTGLPSQFGDVVQVNTITSLNGVLFAGTVLNKIYKSTNAGASWSFSGNGLTTYASTIHDLVTAGNDLYAATEDGIYKSTDAGAGWAVAGSTVGLFQKLEKYKNGKAIFASKYGYTVNTGLGVFVSTNKGASFTDYSTGMFPTANVAALLVDSNQLYGGTDTRSVWIRKLQPAGLQSFDDTGTPSEEEATGFTATATNPFTNKIELQLQANKPGKISIYLADNSGRVIMHKEAVIDRGKSTQTFPISKNLVKGVYILHVMQNETVQTINLVKQ